MRAVFVVLALAGCGVHPAAVEGCRALCDCQTCSEQDVGECESGFDAQAKAAKQGGCEPQWEAWMSCRSAEGVCDDGFWEQFPADCTDLGSTYSECLGSL